MPRKPANVQLINYRAFQAWRDRRFPRQRSTVGRDHATNRSASAVCTTNCVPSIPNWVGYGSSPWVRQLFPAIDAPGVMDTGGQAFDKNVPKEIASVGTGIESYDLKRLRTICGVIQEQVDPLPTPTEDREIDALRRPACPGQKSRTGPCGICFQSADSWRTNYPMAEL